MVGIYEPSSSAEDLYKAEAVINLKHKPTESAKVSSFHPSFKVLGADMLLKSGFLLLLVLVTSAFATDQEPAQPRRARFSSNSPSKYYFFLLNGHIVFVLRVANAWANVQILNGYKVEDCRFNSRRTSQRTYIFFG